MKTDGPFVWMRASCLNCIHCTSESYAVQDDSGHNVYCEHPSIGKKRVGDTNWSTPEWCPLLADAIDKHLKAQGLK